MFCSCHCGKYLVTTHIDHPSTVGAQSLTYAALRFAEARVYKHQKDASRLETTRLFLTTFLPSLVGRGPRVARLPPFGVVA